MALNMSDELPSYMYAADIHNVANGRESMIEGSAGSDVEGRGTLESAAKFSLSVIARAVTSTANIVPAATNWAGLTDIPEWQTEDLLSSFDDDLAAYYSENRDSVDIVGDIAASIVPGMAGVKAVNYGLKALKGLSRGSAGKNVLQSIGTLPDMTDKYAKLGRAKMFETGNTFSLVDANTLKAFGSAYAQNVVEAGAFEIAAATALGDRSPIFKDHTAMDIVYNAALGGGIVGGGLMGTMSAVKTYGSFKTARDVVDRVLNPLRAIKPTVEGTPEFVNLLNLKSQLDNPPAFDPTSGLNPNVAARTLERRQRDLGLSIQESATKIAGGDAELGKMLAVSLKDLPADAAWAASLHLDEVARVGTTTTLETAIEGARIARSKLDDPELVKLMSHQQITGLNKTAAFGDLKSIKYLHLTGENAGQVTTNLSPVVGLADAYGSAELSTQIAKLVGKDGVAGIEWSPVGKGIDAIEARYIVASEQSGKFVDGLRIGTSDLPYLEAAYQKGLNRVVIDGLELDNTQLLAHIKGVKKDFLGVMYAEALVDPLASTAKIAKTLNVKQSLVEGLETVGDEGYFAIERGSDLRNPSILKLAYKGDEATVGVSGDVLSGMATIKQFQETAITNNLKVVSAVIGEENAAMIPRLMDNEVLGTTSAGAGAGLLSAAAGAYQSVASKVEWIGKVTNRLKTEWQKLTNDALQPLMHKVLNNTDASNQLVVIRQKVLETGEKYVLVDGELVLKDVAKYRQALEESAASGKQFKGAAPSQASLDASIKIETPELREFLEGWITHNDEYLGKQKLLRNAIGKDIGSFGGELYFPQPDSRKFSFFSMVVPKNPAEGEKVQMIWASSAEELAKLEGKVPTEFSILRKADTDRYHKAIRDYDYELGFSSGQMKSDMKRAGAASPFFPKTDAPTLMQEMLEWRHRVSDSQVRDAVTLQNQVAFSELKRLDEDYVALQKSTKGTDVKVDSPFGSYVATALDIPRTSHVPVWTDFNNLAENVYSKIHAKVSDTWAKMKSPEDLEKINKALDDGGIRGFKDAYTELFANHPAGGRELSKLVMSANGALSTLLLRTDPMNALNNGLGSIIITGAEVSSLVKSIQSAGGSFADELLQKAFVTVPGSAKQAISPVKLIGSAYNSWFKLLTKNPEMQALEAKFDKAGFLPSMMDQVRSVMDSSTLSGFEKAGELQAKSTSILKGMGEMLEKVSLNRSVEEMNRFVSAHIANEISDLAVRAGKMTDADQFAFINTFVNRTQGNYLASQRPLMFQGPVGHAISLFQTYSFNMMQHVFRRVESGDKKQLALLLGLQTSLYGFNGLPAFDFMNKHLVGQAAGNTSSRDVYSTTQDVAGTMGNWLLYGGLSNATGLGLYSRGDLNPRHLSILPTNPADIPFVSATTGVLGAMVTAGGEMFAGADIGSTFLRGLEHANISRPLAGLAATMQGFGNESSRSFSTTGKDGLINAWDMYSLQSVGRIAGARPMDEAIARDAYHRVQSYDSHRQAQIDIVGSAVRDKVRGQGGAEDVSEEDVNGFLREYLHKGGDQKNFIKFWQKNIKDADVSKINQMVSHANKPHAQYLQSMMHGGVMGEMEK